MRKLDGPERVLVSILERDTDVQYLCRKFYHLPLVHTLVSAVEEILLA